MLQSGKLDSKLVKKISVFSLMTILVFGGLSPVLPALADPPLPEGPNTIFPKVFCLRIMDVREINPNTFDIEFEVLNWSNAPIHKIEFDITSPNMGNVVFSTASIDADGRPLVFADVDNDGLFPPGDLGDFEDTNNDGVVDPGEDKNANDRFDNDEAPGNVNTANNWTVKSVDSTAAVFEAGTPIPNIDLLGATSTAQANALMPGWPNNISIDGNGVIEDPEDIDNGTNVLDGFVIRVTDFDDLETFNMNWFVYDISGNPIGTQQGGNSMGFGMITLSYLEMAGPNPSSSFVGLPSLATDQKDFYGQVYNVDSQLFAGVIPGASAYQPSPPREMNPLPPGFFFTEVAPGVPGDGAIRIFDAVPVGDVQNHYPVIGNQILKEYGLLRGDPGDGLQIFDLDGGLQPLSGTAESDLLIDDLDIILGTNTGGGPLFTDTQIDLFLDGSGTGDGTASFTGGNIPPPDMFLNMNVQARGVPIPANFQLIPTPGDDFPRPGAGFRIGFNQPMDTSILPTNFNQELDLKRNTDFVEIIVPNGAGSTTWIDGQQMEFIFNDPTGISMPGPPGQYSIGVPSTSTLVGLNGELVSRNFLSGGATDRFGGPTPPCFFTPSGLTVITEPCDVRVPSFAQDNIEIASGTLVQVLPGGILCSDLDVHNILIRLTAGINIMSGGAVGDDSVFDTCP